MRFFVISIKKYFFTILFISFTICLLLFSKSNLIAAQNGLALWAKSVLPTLFPFFVATELLCQTNFTYILGKLLNKIMRPIFNVPGESASAIILGTISGYPVGAKVIVNLKNQKIVSKIEAERLISFTNNSGPLFILGTVRNFSFKRCPNWLDTSYISYFGKFSCSDIVLNFGKKINWILILMKINLILNLLL